MREKVIQALLDLRMLPVNPGPDFGNDFDRLQLMGRFARLLDAEEELGEALLRFVRAKEGDKW